MDQNRPRGREKNVTSGGNGVHKRGDGLGTGPVGSSDGYSGRKGGSKIGARAAAGGGGVAIIGIIIALLFGGGGGLGDLGGGQVPDGNNQSYQQDIGSIQGSSSSVNNSVAAGSRDKRTKILGNKKDTVTIMVYMCGTDLESKSGMASSDLSEMAAASFGDNINLIIYTGGCSGWKTSGISNSKNQIYQIKNGKLLCLENDMGSKAMTDPSTLSSFIQYCSSNFPANRNDLIFWDHGGGSISGYGYDETHKSSGSMGLPGISKALKNGGITFDFVGFDACLMATAETALMMNNYADYMIASEETEPGIGWYYTDWLTKLGNNTSEATVDTGKNIVDGFVEMCAKKCRGQQTTLAVIDLAEFANTVPDKLNDFSKSISSLLTNKDYQTVSDARYQTREFAQSSKIDQIDLVDLAEKMGNSEGSALSKAVKNAVKYNRTSTNMTNAYGVSIYFPYKRTSYVDPACSAYKQIGMDSEYSKCIQQFASLETSGQIAAGGSSSSPLTSILGGLSGGSSGSSDMIGQLLSGFLSGRSMNVDGLDGSNTGFMKESPLSDEDTADYLAANYFDSSNLVWDTTSDGQYKIELPENQWKLVHAVDKNVFFDDGSGYIDLGLDNVYDYDDEGNLIADTENTWISINGQPVAYYHTDTTEYGNDQYYISGYVPAKLNGDRVNLILAFDNENPKGYIAGVTSDYKDGETDTVAKSDIELQTGDKLEFLCDYYSYNGDYQDSYYLGEPMTVNDVMTISDTDIGDGNSVITYRFTDIYNQEYWTEKISK